MLFLFRTEVGMKVLYIFLFMTCTKATKSTNIIEEIVSIPFFEVYLSAFLGFLSAIIVEAIKDCITSKQKRKQIVKNLIIELETIKDEVSGMEDTKLYPLPYSIPFWKGICMSGTVLVLDKMNSYSNLICVFEKIEESNHIEGKCFEIVMSSQKRIIDKEMLEIILKNRKKLLGEIDKGLKLLKEVK